MGTLPSLAVLLDDGSGTYPFDITSQVLAVDGYEITRGREDWQGAVTAGELTVTLNNSDGRFTPGSTILGTPSPIKVDAKIQVVESLGSTGFGVGGFGSGLFGSPSRFSGYVKSWPVAWPATVSTFATVQITATDAQARAERRTLRSMLEEEVLLNNPAAYYALGEAQGSKSAGDTSGNAAAPLQIAGTGATLGFGTDDGSFDGGTGVTFSGGQYLKGPVFSTPGVYGVLFRMTTTRTAPCTILQVGSCKVSITGGNVLATSGPSSINLGSGILDGKPHDIALIADGTYFIGYIDGPAATFDNFRADTTALPLNIGGGDGFSGTISHFALLNNAPSASEVQALHNLNSSVSTEPSSSRFTRLAGYAGISVGSLDASLTNIPTSSTVGTSAWDALQEVADAELGLVFVNGSGDLTFYNRRRVSGKSAPDLILDSQFITPDVQPVVDDQQIINYLEVTSVATGATGVVRSQSSEDAHGRYPQSTSYLVLTDQEALDRGNWIISKQAEPTPRYGTLTINLYKMTADQASTVLAALDLDCWLRVTSMASQNPGGTVADVVVQGWRETVTAENWTVTCNVVARSLFSFAKYDDPASTYDNSIYGL